MASATTQERTEQPTGKRLTEARGRGQIPKSRDLTAVAVLLIGSLAVYFSGGLIFDSFRRMLETMWTKEAFTSPAYLTGSGIATGLISTMCVMIGPSVLAMFVTAVLLNMVQMKGFIFSYKAMKMGLSNLNPGSGFKRMFSLRSGTEVAKSLLKMLTVSYAVYSVIWPERAVLAELTGREASDLIAVTGAMSLRVIIRVAAIMLAISLLDFFYQKWQTRKDLMMTRQEVKEEMKQQEGNPQIKARIRSIQRALARQRMLTKVPKASVVITNPTHYAVALLYKPGMEAPVLVAKGMNVLALKIIAIGRKHGVPIMQNPPLARALYKQVKLDETIPVALYRAVAKILAYIYQQKQLMRRNQNG